MSMSTGRTLRMGGSTAMLLEMARGTRLETSFSGMVSAVMRSLEGELFARPISCTPTVGQSATSDATPVDASFCAAHEPSTMHEGLVKYDFTGICVCAAHLLCCSAAEA